MAIVVHFQPERLDQSAYQTLRALMDTQVGPYPHGRLGSYCFGEGDQLQVLDIWDSREHLDTFVQQLLPQLAAQGIAAGTPQVYPVISQRDLGYIGALRDAHDAFSVGDHAAAEHLVAPTLRFTDHARGITATTRCAFRSWLDSHKAMASQMRITEAHYSAAGAWVTARFQVTGIQDGPLGPFPPSGKPFTLSVCEHWHFNEHGEADEGHNYSDGLGLAVQLGHIAP